MGTVMESKLSPEQHAMVMEALRAQTESLGVLEAPLVAELLERRGVGAVLDIGCGDGSFLLKVAASLPGVRFTGVDHSEMAVRDARRKVRRRGASNVEVRQGFFDPGWERDRWDAITTRFTLQHASRPEAFVSAVHDRLERGGSFMAVESLDGYTDCQVPDETWRRFRTAVEAIHDRVGSNANIGKSLASLLASCGFREVRVRLLLCSPATVGFRRFRDVVQALARLASSLSPDLFSPELLEEVTSWLGDRAGIERRDPYLCSAIADGVRR